MTRIDAAIISNVRVPQDVITIDSIVGSMCYFSGVVYYDLEQIEAGLKVHIYIENPPCKGYQFGNSIEYDCHAVYQLIDTLCNGDLGFVHPGKDKVIRWRYASSKNNTYAKIKIGISNRKTVLVKSCHTPLRSGSTKVITEYLYNSCGQMFKRISSYFSQDTVTYIIYRTFNIAGQVTATDTPFQARTSIMTYDSLYRLSDTKTTDVDQFLGWVYGFDQKSRTVSATPYVEFGSVKYYLNALITKYDEWNRMVYNYRKAISSARDTQDVYTYDYFPPIRNSFKDSTVATYYKKERLILKNKTEYSYNQDSTVSYTITTNTTIDSLGNNSFNQKKKIYLYDNAKNLLVELDSVRNSPDSPFVFRQVLNTYEYDQTGNKTHWWSGNKVTLERVQTYTKDNLPVTQTVYPNVNDSVKTEFIWKTIDLDTITEQ